MDYDLIWTVGFSSVVGSTAFSLFTTWRGRRHSADIERQMKELQWRHEIKRLREDVDRLAAAMGVPLSLPENKPEPEPEPKKKEPYKAGDFGWMEK